MSQEEEEVPGALRDRAMVTVADHMQFCSLAEGVLEKIAAAPNKKEKEKRLKKCVEHFRKAYHSIHGGLDSEKGNGDSIFSLIRLIIPSEDKSRAPYGMQGTALAKIFVEAMGLDKNSSDAEKLIKFRNPLKSQSSGDLGSLVYSVLQPRLSKASGKESPSLRVLNDFLDSLAKTGGVNSRKQVQLLSSFIRKLTPLEGKWLVRLILKQMSLWISKSQVYGVIHPQAASLLESTGSLETVCRRLNDPNAVVDDTEIHLFSPFKQMLCSSLNVQYDISDQRKSREDFGNLPDPPFIVEIKFDGERCQIHYDRSREASDQFRYFSRRGIDNTCFFKETHTPHLLPQIKSTCSSFVLDGEMMAYRHKTGGFTHKGQKIDVRKMKADDPEHCPAFVAFDIVYLNGKSLISVPLQDRLKMISEALDPKDGIVFLSKTKTLETKEEIMNELNQAVEDFQEGLIVKECQSVYEIGKRASTWIKIKPEYFSETSVEDIDVVILGAYYSDSTTHRGRGSINHFLVGLLGKSSAGKEEFYPLSRVGTGRMRHPEIHQLIQELKPKFTTSPDPSNTVHLKNFKKPDLYINPKKSVVVQIKAMEILSHEDYAIKFTLRFARIVKVRHDKPWNEIMTVDQFNELQKSFGGRFAKRSDGVGSSEKKRPPPLNSRRRSRSYSGSPEPPRTHSRVAQQPTVAQTGPKYFSVSSAYKLRKTPVKVKPSLVKQNIFDSKVFRVIGSHSWKQEIEKKVIENGGVIVQNNTSDLFAIIAEKKSAPVETLMKRKEFDILKLSWLERCIEHRCVETILPQDCFSAGLITQEILSKEYDEYGDHYTKRVSSLGVRRLLEKIIADDNKADDSGAEDGDGDASRKLQSFLDSELDSVTAAKLQKFNFFQGLKIAFRNPEELDPLELFGLNKRIEFYGGQTASEFDSDITHVIVSNVHSPVKKQQLAAHTVRDKWLLDCLDQKKALSEFSYLT